MTNTVPPSGMIPIAEFAIASDALVDLSLLRQGGISALLWPDPTTAPTDTQAFRLLVPESAGLEALQLLAREARSGDPRVDACPRCGSAGLRIPTARRLLGLAELVLGNEVAPVVPACPRCGWSPARDVVDRDGSPEERKPSHPAGEGRGTAE